MSTVHNKKGNLSTNVVANVIGLSTNIAVGLFLVPFLIQRLGIEVYGLIPLANYFVRYLSLMSHAVNAAVGRYLTVAIENRQIDETKAIFNTAFWGNLAVALLLFLLSIPIITFLDKIINLPAGTQWSSRFLFFSIFLAFFVTLTSSVFSVAPWCLNRFDLMNTINIFRQGSYVAFILILFSLQASLFSVGTAILASALLRAVMSFFLSRRLFPYLRISTEYFDKASLSKLLSTGGWITVNKIGAILYLNIDLLVINRFLGTSAGGQYASVLQWSILIRMLAAAISPVFGPPLVWLFARNDSAGLGLYARRAVKFLGLMTALPIGLVSGFSAPLLTLWLGKEFAGLSTLLTILTIHLCVNVAVYPLFELQAATNKVRLPGIVTCIMGAANFGLVLFLARWTSWGIYGVAAAGAVMLTLKNAFFTPIYGAQIIGQAWHAFLKELLHITAASCAVFLIARSMLRVVDINTWVELILFSVFIGIAYCIAVWAILSRDERHLVTSKIGEFLRGVGIAYAGK